MTKIVLDDSTVAMLQVALGQFVANTEELEEFEDADLAGPGVVREVREHLPRARELLEQLELLAMKAAGVPQEG